MNRKNHQYLRLPLLLLVAIFLLLNFSSAIAEIYKFVAPDGSVTYSERKPVKSDKAVEVLNLYKNQSSDTDESNQRFDKRVEQYDERREAAQKKSLEMAEAQAEIKRNEAACESAKRRVASLTRPRVNAVDENGQRSRMSEQWRQEQMVAARKAVADFCQ